MPSREKLAEFTAWCAADIARAAQGQARSFPDFHPAGLPQESLNLR